MVVRVDCQWRSRRERGLAKCRTHTARWLSKAEDRGGGAANAVRTETPWPAWPWSGGRQNVFVVRPSSIFLALAMLENGRREGADSRGRRSIGSHRLGSGHLMHPDRKMPWQAAASGALESAADRQDGVERIANSVEAVCGRTKSLPLGAPGPFVQRCRDLLMKADRRSTARTFRKARRGRYDPNPLGSGEKTRQKIPTIVTPTDRLRLRKPSSPTRCIPRASGASPFSKQATQDGTFHTWRTARQNSLPFMAAARAPRSLPERRRASSRPVCSAVTSVSGDGCAPILPAPRGRARKRSWRSSRSRNCFGKTNRSTSSCTCPVHAGFQRRPSKSRSAQMAWGYRLPVLPERSLPAWSSAAVLHRGRCACTRRG